MATSYFLKISVFADAIYLYTTFKYSPIGNPIYYRAWNYGTIRFNDTYILRSRKDNFHVVDLDWRLV